VRQGRHGSFLHESWRNFLLFYRKIFLKIYFSRMAIIIWFCKS
jgi:hypothetical protein